MVWVDHYKTGSGVFEQIGWYLIKACGPWKNAPSDISSSRSAEPAGITWLLDIMIIDNMDPHSGKKTKDSIIAPKSVAKGLSGMPMDIVFEVRQILSLSLYSAFNMRQLRYLNIWILWTSCGLLGLPRPFDPFSWAARPWLCGSASDVPTIRL